MKHQSILFPISQFFPSFELVPSFELDSQEIPDSFEACFSSNALEINHNMIIAVFFLFWGLKSLVEGDGGEGGRLDLDREGIAKGTLEREENMQHSFFYPSKKGSVGNSDRDRDRTGILATKTPPEKTRLISFHLSFHPPFTNSLSNTKTSKERIKT